MANELTHKSVGTSMTQAEYEATDSHVLNSQATGDLIYASSANQLSRLAIGSANNVLHVSGGIPAWTSEVASLTLNNSVAKGTWTASGTWTIPAVTLGGTIAGNSQTVDNITAVGIGKTTPGRPIHIRQAATAEGSLTSSIIIESAAAYNLTPTCGIQFGNKYNVAGSLAGMGGISVSKENVTDGSIASYLSLHTRGSSDIIEQIRVSSSGNTSFLRGFLELNEMAAPGAGAANTVRIYAEVGAGDLTDLSAVFQDGTAIDFAEETTPLDAPIFTKPSGSSGNLVMRKSHPGEIEFLIDFGNGETFRLKRIRYHDADKLAANKGCDSALPRDWEVTTLQERVNKQLSILDEEIKSLNTLLPSLNQPEAKAISGRISNLTAKKVIELARLN